MLQVNSMRGFGSGVASSSTLLIPGEINNWTAGTTRDDFTFTGSDIDHATAQGTDAIYTGGTVPIVLSGNFTVDVINTSEANSWSWGCFAVDELGEHFSATLSDGGMNSMDNSILWNGETVKYASVGKGSTTSLAATDVMRIQRTDTDTFDFQLDTGSGFASFGTQPTETFSGDMYVCFASNNTQSFDSWTYSWNE
jgi:hypothetical protein